MSATSKTAVLDVAVGGSYARLQQRLRTSLADRDGGADLLFWTEEYPPGSPPHGVIPYAFKPHAFRVARERGYDRALWIDSAIVGVGPLADMLAHLSETGELLYASSWRVGQWATDAALDRLGLSRDDAMEINDCWACVVGLDFRSDRANRFLDLWLEFADDGVTFCGPWSNDNGEASTDPRCLGHRHDQVVAAALCHRLEIPRLAAEPPRYFAYADMPVNDSVCLVSTRV